MSILQNLGQSIGQGIGQSLPFTVTVVLFGLIFTALNRRIEAIEKRSVDKEVCEKAQDAIEADLKGSMKTMEAKIDGLKETVCAKIDGIKEKIDILINGEE